MAIEVNWKRFWVPVLAVVVATGALWFTNSAVTPRAPTWDDVVAEARHGGYGLINTDEVRRRYEADPQDILLVDNRQEWEFAMGHIRGAVNFPMEPTAWARWQKKGRLAETLGADKNRLIVFY
jgi:3-mercaptopyruvate sulfurtransferase SseA